MKPDVLRRASGGDDLREGFCRDKAIVVSRPEMTKRPFQKDYSVCLKMFLQTRGTRV